MWHSLLFRLLLFLAYAAAAAALLRYVVHAVARKKGYSRESAERVLASAGFSLLFEPRRDRPSQDQ